MRRDIRRGNSVCDAKTDTRLGDSGRDTKPDTRLGNSDRGVGRGVRGVLAGVRMGSGRPA
jgi:hypothetical protein